MLKSERNEIRDEIRDILNSQVDGQVYGGIAAPRLTELINHERILTNQIETIYYEQLRDYRVEGNYYVSNVDGVEIKMSKSNFRPPAKMVGKGNTPINFAIERLDRRALAVLIENSRSLNLDSVGVSSLWREKPYSKVHTPIPSRGIDIVAATRDGVTVYLNNSKVGQQSQAAMALRNEVYNSMVNDSRVSQALDPWYFRSKVVGNIYNEPNTWQNELDTAGYTLNEYIGMSDTQRKDLFTPMQIRMIEHRHHLHITIFNY